MRPRVPKHRNTWSDPGSVSPGEASQMAVFLEDRARRPDQVQVNGALRDVLSPRSGERLLEVGCGSGALCRLIAPALMPDGELIGLDVARDMVAAARRYASETLDIAPLLRFEIGAAEKLPYGDATFDAAFAARLLLHVTDRVTIVREMARVVRPGGRIVMMDWDFETVTVDHANRTLTRRVLNWRCDHRGGDNWSGRRLMGYALDAGLRQITITPVVTVVRDEAAALTGSLWRAAAAACEAGAITPAEHDDWVAELRERIADGRFLASIVYFIVRGEREDAWATPSASD